MAKNEQVRVDLTAEDKASAKIDKVADAAEALEKLDPEVEITADTGRAEADVKGLRDDVERLSREDAEVVLRARVDDARAGLKALQTEMAATREEAEQTVRRLDDVTDGGRPGGAGLRGNAISDLTGPLGEASGAASDFAGVMDGLDDTITEVASRLGASSDTIARISSTMGLVGVGVAAAATAWSIFSAQQAKAREEAKRTEQAIRDVNDALAEQDWRRAAQGLTETFDDAYAAAKRAGIPVEDLTRFIMGLTDQVPITKREFDALESTIALMEVTPEALRSGQAEAAYAQLVAILQGAADQYAETNLSITEQDRVLGIVSGSLEGAATDTGNLARTQQSLRTETDKLAARLDALRQSLSFEQAMQGFRDAVGTALQNAQTEAGITNDDILAIKDSILTVAETAKTNPAVVEAQLESVTAGNLWEVAGNVESYYARNPVQIRSRLSPPEPGSSAAAGNQPRSLPPLPDGGGGEPSVTNVTMALPVGWRGDPLAAVHTTARRSGGYYRRVGRR